MYSTAFRGVVMTLLLAVLAIGPLRAQSAQELFQQALSKERAQGQLHEAIALYQRVVKEAGPDRALAAKAALQIAICQETLGNPAAKAGYERVIKDYPDQAEAVSTARGRLAALANVARGETTVTSTAANAIVRPTSFSGTGIISPDGQWFLIGGGPQRNVRYLQPYRSLYIRHVRTGEVRAVDAVAPAVERMQNFVWSPDSKRVAYNKCYAAAPPDRPNQLCELAVTAIDGGTPQGVYPKSPHMLSPLAWSPDGRSIAMSCYGRTTPGEESIVLLSLADGSIRDLKTIQRNEASPETHPAAVAFSPDGRFLTYSLAEWNKPRDVILLALDGSGEHRLIENPADDRFIAWTPAGNLLFRSDRSGTIDLWIATVVDGRVSGVPWVVKRDIGPFTSHGLSAQGALYYLTPGAQEMSLGPDAVSFEEVSNDIYLAVLDRSGLVASAPAIVNGRNPGRANSPMWSPDGRSLFYRTRQIGTHVWSRLSILSFESGDEREVRPDKLNNLSAQASWMTPDGRSLLVIGLVPGANGANARHLFRVDAATGATSDPIGSVVTGAAGAQLLNDGRTLVAFRAAGGGQAKNPAAITARDIETDVTRVVYETAPGVQLSGLAVSADGTLAACREVNAGKSRLIVVTLADGAVREVTPLPSTFAGAHGTAWSPDGRYIYFVERREASSTSDELWRVASAGGQPQKVMAFDAEIVNPSIHPNGRYLAFASQRRGEMRELLLEGFLPASELTPRATSGR